MDRHSIRLVDELTVCGAKEQHLVLRGEKCYADILYTVGY